MEQVEFVRDCDAIEIPAGRTVQLAKGTAAFVMQTLGGSFTLEVPARGLFRIASKDVDAIGKAGIEGSAEVAEEAENLEQRAWAQLRSCYDPEIPVNIVDLGLIYSMAVIEEPDSGEYHVRVDMTLTAPGCGMGPVIALAPSPCEPAEGPRSSRWNRYQR